MFTGLKIVELASVLAGPSVGQFFAELGADVVKIENLLTGGDVTRSWKTAGEREGDCSAYFCSCNWEKKSLAIDLITSRGKQIVQKLIAKSDIVIASYKPGDAGILGVSYEQLATINPQLIYGQITGYGSESDRVGYDAVVQAESGFMDLNGEKDGPPLKMPVALIDILAGHQLKEGLLIALLKKEKTGQGSFVEVSLIQAAIASLANQATNWLMTNQIPTRKGSAHPNIAPYGESFETRDGKRIILAIGNDKQFINLMTLLGHEEVAKMPAYNTNKKRVINRVNLNDILKQLIEKAQSGELLPRLHAAKIPAGLIQNVKEVFEMPEGGALLFQSHGSMGVKNFVAGPSEWRANKLLPPPRFGEHTEEILKELREGVK